MRSESSSKSENSVKQQDLYDSNHSIEQVLYKLQENEEINH